MPLSSIPASNSAQAEGGSFLRRAGPLVLARLVSAMLTLAIPLVLARWMDLTQYGTYKQLILMWSTICLIIPFGVVQGLYFFVPRTVERRPFIANALLFALLGGLAMCGVFASIIEPIARYFHNPELFEFRWTLGLYAAFYVGSTPLEIGLTSQGKTKISALSYLVSDGLRCLTMVVPILLGWGLSGMMTALVAFAGLRLIAAWVVSLSTTTGPVFDGRRLWSQLVYAAPFGAAMLLAVPQQYAHQYAVSGIVSPELFAIYAVGCFQLPIVELFYTPTSEVLMVQLGELEKSHRMREAVGSFREASAKLSLVFFPMAAFLFAAAPEFIVAMFGPKFVSSVPIFRVSVVGVVLAVLPMDGVLRARNQTRHIFLSYLIKALVTIPLVYIGVRSFGMMGGIGSWALAEGIGKAALMVKVPEALSSPDRRLRFVEVIAWKDFGRASVAAGAAALAVVVLRALSAQAWASLPAGFIWRAIPLGLSFVLFCFGYIATLRATGVRPMGLLASLRRPRASNVAG